MSEKKMVNRSAAIALGVICIVVVAGLIGAFAYFVSDKNSTISSLNTQINQLNSNVTSLQDQVNDLNDSLGLGKVSGWINESITVNQPAGSYSSWNFSAPYAGTIEVLVAPPTVNCTYIRVLWNYSQMNIQYDYQTIGRQQNGQQYAAFPVLPTSNVEIRIGNTVPGEIEYILISIAYWY